MASVFNHVGLCVTDVDRSQRFYEGLGFRLERALRPPDGVTGTLLGVPSPRLTAIYLTMDGFVLELLHFDRPGNPQARQRVMNEPGLTHLSVTVDDMPSVLKQLPALGGQVVESSNIGAAVMVRDPDGQLVELIPVRVPPV